MMTVIGVRNSAQSSVSYCEQWLLLKSSQASRAGGRVTALLRCRRLILTRCTPCGHYARNTVEKEPDLIAVSSLDTLGGGVDTPPAYRKWSMIITNGRGGRGRPSGGSGSRVNKRSRGNRS
ncbi:hypothetical protein EVAR_13974_1 [Eumeta japonica]|uniref:Uncharacterized protein n=1 Tax=Eumeta variegata TaxID=151549 RepID=A0A4C1U8F1_EUMVA|nr:hypothetical protein EVAR_13974_1 [Eumeta japonica]